MAWSLLFWLGLLLPGYVLVRLVSAEELKRGLLGTIGVSYLAVFGVLSPVSILCYVFQMPLAVFSAACVVLFVVSLLEVTRRHWWSDLGKLLAGGVCVELGLLVADLIMSGRVGAFLSGDSRLHVARIRFLLEHGFSNFDPFVAGQHFLPIYHTNLYHALSASCAQLMQVEVLDVWFMNLVWAKLVIACGIYYLARVIFDRSWVAWLAVLFAVAGTSPVTFLLYPNKIAPLWLLPMMIGFAVQAVAPGQALRSAAKLAVGSLVLGQVHALYGGHAGVMLAPVLLAVLATRLLRGRRHWWHVGVCVAALSVAAPFALVSKYGVATSMPTTTPAQASVPAQSAQGIEQTNTKKPEPQKTYGFRWTGERLSSKPIGKLLRGKTIYLLAGGMVFALIGSRRRQVAVLAGVCAVVLVVQYVPPVCERMISAVGPLSVSRMSTPLQLGAATLFPGAIAFLVERRLRFWWLRSLLSVLVAIGGVWCSGKNEPHDWATYYRRATSSAKQRHAWRSRFGQNQTLLRRHVPAGATILAGSFDGQDAVMIYDCRVVMGRGCSGVADRKKRESDLRVMLSPTTPWSRRRDLLNAYNIEYFVIGPSSFRSSGWVSGHVVDQWKQGSYLLVQLGK